MNSKKPSSIREQILAKIEHNEVRMRSRTFFVLKLASVIVLTLLVLAISVFIGNFVFFILRLNGHDSLLSLGVSGFGLFVRVFPWWLLIIDIALIALLVWLVRKFQFGYRKPVLYMFLGLIFLAALAGFVLDHETSFNDHLLRNADRDELPPGFQSIYLGARHAPPPGEAHRGTITDVGTSSIEMLDPDLQQDLPVLLPPGWNMQSQLTVGETIFVVGPQIDDVIHARFIHPIGAEGIPPPPPPAP